jgi:hypothetical protein
MTSNGKHSSLLRYEINYGRKSFMKQALDMHFNLNVLKIHIIVQKLQKPLMPEKLNKHRFEI